MAEHRAPDTPLKYSLGLWCLKCAESLAVWKLLLESAYIFSLNVINPKHIWAQLQWVCDTEDDPHSGDERV